MASDETSYSLWLRPNQSQIDELVITISRLAHQHRTFPFPPHITLLSSISGDLLTIKKICKKLTLQQTAFDISLRNIAYTEHYFRNLFIVAEMNAELEQLYRRTKSQFNIELNETYLPHISLLYGQLNEKKQQLLQNELAESYPKIFNCSRLDIYNTTGKENEWRLIESFDFN